MEGDEVCDLFDFWMVAHKWIFDDVGLVDFG